MNERSVNAPNAATSSCLLKVDWCDHAAAKYAVTNWHYSKSMPAGKIIKIGAWENGIFVGCVLFSHGSNRHIGTAYGCTELQCCELVRVALTTHATPVTRIIAIALKMLSKQSPGLRLVISYADCDQNHHGGIYAGGGWTYFGKVELNGGQAKYTKKKKKKNNTGEEEKKK